jgi:phosphoribosyl-ATP pyrophosphohydrolase/phosphoribosyl-AMP cyclohydrolase
MTVETGTRLFDPGAVAFGPGGLVPAIVQDSSDSRVLMLAWMDAEALEATLRTGEVHFHSRSRDRLWRKGETSGNVLHLVDVVVDCDGDALLVTARPEGPTCHRGTRSCFDRRADGASQFERASEAERSVHEKRAELQDFAWLETLWQTITDRAATRPAGSYTASLLDGGVDVVARKVAEEATEVVLAAKDDANAEASSSGRRADTRTALAGEMADLLYHALVLVAERGLTGGEVVAILRERHNDRPGNAASR